MWKNININIQNIEASTERSVLVKMPNKSKYVGFKFWHPAKLIRNGRHSYAVSLGYTDEFKFKLFKTGARNKVVKSVEIDSKEFEQVFDVMNENINEKQQKEIEVHIPKKIEAPKKVTINEELLDD